MTFSAVLCFVGFALFVVKSSAGAEARAADTKGSDDIAASVICNVIVFVQRLGLPIMTGVILGASKMAIFGKLAWAAIVMLVVFTAIFFGAGKLIQKFAAGVNGDIGKAEDFKCEGGGNTKLPDAARAQQAIG
ncbi:TrbC/VirB2 family protein [Candidatus Anaplasma sp. TIGMIC]|uniref:TrbC/VirB2 family protein n=1 Tax=Candidatus Anaplasma sp. TIGMIC TaxID=3020713 RepID=UPI0039777AC5